VLKSSIFHVITRVEEIEIFFLVVSRETYSTWDWKKGNIQIF
jgi:hypothetical protein